MMLPRPVVLLLVPLLALTGCLGDDAEPAAYAPPASTGNDTPAVGEHTTGGLGAAETNRTAEGFGGQPHIHDYWADRTEVVLLDRVVMGDVGPFFPDRDPADGRLFQAYFDLPEGAFVYEGTGILRITVGPTSPADVPLDLWYQTPRSDEWSDPVSVTPGAAIEIEVTPETADSPHGMRSFWSFRFTSAAAVKALPPTTEIPTTVVAVKARNVEFWPGHPDFYAESPSRVVLDVDATTTSTGIAEGMFFGDRGSFVRADRLISMGTTRLEIHVNVTGYNGPPGTEPSGRYFLSYRHANMTRESGNAGASATTTEDTYVHFSNLTVDHFRHDPPYAELSRWLFRINTFAGAGGGGCNGCVPYDLSYHITVIAWNDDWVDPDAAVEPDESGAPASSSGGPSGTAGVPMERSHRPGFGPVDSSGSQQGI